MMSAAVSLLLLLTAIGLVWFGTAEGVVSRVRNGDGTTDDQLCVRDDREELRRRVARGAALWHRWRETGDIDVLREWLEASRHALELTPLGGIPSGAGLLRERQPHRAGTATGTASPAPQRNHVLRPQGRRLLARVHRRARHSAGRSARTSRRHRRPAARHLAAPQTPATGRPAESHQPHTRRGPGRHSALRVRVDPARGCPRCGGPFDQIFFYTDGLAPFDVERLPGHGNGKCRRCGRKSTVRGPEALADF